MVSPPPMPLSRSDAAASASHLSSEPSCAMDSNSSIAFSNEPSASQSASLSRRLSLHAHRTAAASRSSAGPRPISPPPRPTIPSLVCSSGCSDAIAPYVSSGSGRYRQKNPKCHGKKLHRSLAPQVIREEVVFKVPAQPQVYLHALLGSGRPFRAVGDLLEDPRLDERASAGHRGVRPRPSADDRDVRSGSGCHRCRPRVCPSRAVSPR